MYYNFFTVSVLLTHNKLTQYLYHFAGKRRGISEYIVHCSYFLKMSKRPLNCLLKLPMCLPHGYKTDVKSDCMSEH